MISEYTITYTEGNNPERKVEKVREVFMKSRVAILEKCPTVTDISIRKA